ncbi:DJ-1/PfpI family protein [Nocardiopsis sp. N85]|uniref:GlxA family transcriptional regulator n=1 Tax=Nocardiopsis sp. N85 TaxID=3029400 RepID=UPI00237EF141|nr:DJ-1/PfpI family protein [Nocardiopsis sp. N85]MDE3723983.1 DJ-1/PfpI family protein [Nocardiopsis sp. N85]
MTRRAIVMVAYDGVRLLDVTAPVEVFTTAAGQGGEYTVSLCSPTGRDVLTSAGTRLGVDTAVHRVREAHTLIVPGSPDLPRRPRPEGLSEAVDALAGRSERVASVCTGAFVLADAGLLDGRRATTHWRHTALLARTFPRVRVEPDAIYVRDGRILTSAGVSAGLDLSLALVEEDEGSALAREVARDLVVFLQRPGGQSQFSVTARTSRPRQDVLRPVLDAVAADPAGDHSVPAMAGRAGMSTRHLSRLFRERLGGTPAAHVESVRLEAACALLEAGESVTGAAERSGLGSDESLRRVFWRRLGLTPSAYRDRFRTARREPRPPEQDRASWTVRGKGS